MIARKHFRWIFVPSCLLGIALTIAWFAGYRVNLTDSFPRGLWRLTDGPIVKGQLVLFCPPDAVVFRAARTAGYLSYGLCVGGFAPLIKRLVGEAGDPVRIGATGVIIDGEAQAKSGLIATDLSGWAVPHVSPSGIESVPGSGNGPIPAGHAWFMSDYNVRSFDSRYFGAVPTGQILSRVVPVWTFGAPEGGHDS